MTVISAEPIPHIAASLFTIFLIVLILPFKVRKIEENLEAFFLAMGILAVTVSSLWSVELVKEALKDPVSVGGLPIGIFQVVLFAGIAIYKFSRQIYGGIISAMNKLGLRFFVFLLILLLSLASSIISVIVTAVILSEIIAVMPIEREKKVKITVITCFAVGLGAALTPVGEPLSTIAVSKLKGEPYHADFFFLFDLLAVYIIPGVVVLSVLGSMLVSKAKGSTEVPEYTESLRFVILRAFRVYMFVAALVLLGRGLTPLVIWYFTKIPPQVLYWVNMISAVLDNATLTAAEIAPQLSLMQIKSALIGLLISGGMLIPGNIPNIVAAGRLRITSKDWARTGVPLGLVLMTVYFVILLLEGSVHA
ncbi:MAG: cation transporter [Archaeoglobales archaeon]|nr:MAG: cation transporter [Archaeoglobales archaeon]